MRKILIFKVFLALVVICVISNEAPAGDTIGVRKKGLVIYRDRILEPPFKFTGFEEDTLRLNGIPYYPARVTEEDRRDRGQLLPDSVVEKIKIKLEKERLLWNRPPKPEGTYELMVSAHNRADSAETFEEELATYARIMAESPHVDSTTIMGNTVAVYWKHDRPEAEYCTIPIEDPPTLTEEERLARRLKSRRHDVERFWDIYNNGGTIGFGGFSGHLYAPELVTKGTLKAIEKLKRGDTLTAMEKMRSIFSQKESLKLFKRRFKRMREGE